MSSAEPVPVETSVDPATLPDTLRRVMRSVEVICDKYLGRHQLTMARYEFLLAAFHRPGAILKDIAKAMNCSAGNVTSLATTLEHEGWIIRCGVGEDRRAVAIRLTDKGMGIESIARDLQDHVRKKIVSKLPETDIAMTIAALTALHIQLQAD